MVFEELSNEEWSLVGPVLNARPLAGVLRRGRPRIQTRVVANAVLWVLTTGQSWTKLPARYPSQPTCRGRFEEWRRGGKLTEMIRILSGSGRRILYVPDIQQSQMECKPRRNAHQFDSNGQPQVVWRSQESWHRGHSSSDLGNSHFALLDEASLASLTNATVTASIDDTNIAEDLTLPAREDRRQGAFWMGLAAKGDPVPDERGYVIYVAVDAVPGHVFRGWAEIVRDGVRVARSGLVGPRFAVPEAAWQFAYDWAYQWIEQQSRQELDLWQGEAEFCRN